MRELVSRVERRSENDPEFLFWCPGCGCCHWFKTTGKGPCWTWNGDLARPTVDPSIRVQHGRYITEAVQAAGLYPEKEIGEYVPILCHLYVCDGKIQFLSDCTHAFRSRTVDMIPLAEVGEE